MRVNNFEGGIWSEEVFNNESAEWLKGIEKKLEDTGQQEDIVITPELLTRQANKLSNWKAPRPDGLQGFWLKNIKSIRQALAAMLNECLNKNHIPDWLTKGLTTLTVKDKTKGNVITNFLPITCLPQMWKLVTGVLADEMYAHLERNNLLPDEQRGCRKRARGSKDQLLIDRMILKNCKKRQVGLAMGWIDYKKAYDIFFSIQYKNLQ